MKTVVILGSTGSIGRNTLRVLDTLSDRFRIIGLAAHRHWRPLLDQAGRYGVRHVGVANPAAAAAAAAAAPRGLHVHAGPEGILEIATLDEAEIVVGGMVGTAGLRPVLAALQRGRTVALATKEVLVAAGALVTRVARRHRGRLIPVDSEHSAIFQCLSTAGHDPAVTRQVRRLVLTASGGPFHGRPEVDLTCVSAKEALRHPRWKMGRKVTVDSATLMNKGLEIIEARWLFDIPSERINVWIHPESVVHSMVEFVDGTLLAQMSLPDMRFAIQYALTWPERVEGRLPRLDLTRLEGLHFSVPDEKRFPCLKLAREAERTGGTMPAVLNAANEVAVRTFLAGRIRLSRIWEIIAEVMERHVVVRDPSLEDIFSADAWSRRLAEELTQS